MIFFKKENQQAYESFVEKTKSIIIPINTILEVMRVIGNDTDIIKINVEESQIFFQVDSIHIVSRLINGKYPEYRQIIPEKFATEIIIQKEEVLRAVKIAGIFTNNKTGEVKFIIDPEKGEVLVQSKAEAIGENKAKLHTQITGPSQEVVFNPRYMTDGLQAISSSKLAMLINNGASPAVLRMYDDEKKMPVTDFTYVIMPIKN